MNSEAIAARDEQIRELEEQLKKHESPTYSVVAERNAKIAELEKRNHELRVKVGEERTKKNEALAEVAERDRTIAQLQQELTAATDTARNHPAIAREDLEKMRDRILASLKLGKQSPGYKATRQALDKFIEQMGKWHSKAL